jgi:hypothetical protein
MIINTVSDMYAVSRRTLDDRLSRKLIKAELTKTRKLLTEVEDTVLREFILLQIELNFPPIIDMIQRAATSLI